MVAGVLLATHPSVYTAIHESVAHCRRKQEVIEPHALVCSPPVALVIPECPERPVGVQPFAEHPSSLETTVERTPAGSEVGPMRCCLKIVLDICLAPLVQRCNRRPI